MSKKAKKIKSANWSAAETAELITIYGDYYDKLESMSFKKPIFQAIAKKLKEKMMIKDKFITERTPHHVQRKITKLRLQYRDEKPGPTGKSTPSTWVHYDAMHKILHENPVLTSNADKTSKHKTPNNDEDDDDDDDIEDGGSPGSPVPESDPFVPTEINSDDNNAFVTHCTSCDKVISDLKKTGRSTEEKGSDYLTDRRELNTFRRHLLSHVNRSEVAEVLDSFNKQLPLCSLCMEMISRIYDFESEIDRIKSLIDSMVAFLKSQVLATFGSESRSNWEDRTLKIRTLIACELDDLPITEQVPSLNFTEGDVSFLLAQVRKSYNKFQGRKSVAKVEVPDPPSSSKDPDDHESLWKDETNAESSSNNAFADWDMPEAVSYDGSGDEQEDEDLSEEDISIDGSIVNKSKNPGEQSSTKLRSPAVDEIPKRRERKRKTDRIVLRRSKPLGDNCFELDGHKYSKEDNGTWKCDTCSEVHTRRDTLVLHIKRSHLGEVKASRSYLCETCGKSFKNQNCHRLHLLIHSDVKAHQCHICGRMFRSPGNLIHHKRTHRGPGVKYHECDWEGCDRKFLERKTLVRHVLAHKGLRPHICGSCGKGFRCPTSLRTHLKTHAGPEARKLICDICGKSWLFNKDLKRHKVNVHKVNC